jgi:MoaA/NifB/PqqE/SkfB family radical SAM enzyme
MDFYNSQEMCQLRSEFLAGNKPEGCSACYYQESFGKLNGRKKQLLKSGVTTEDFDLKMRASPHYKHFEYSLNNNGAADYMPVDLQIDLGNVCNSACIMCRPDQSSRLATDYHKLNEINPTMFAKPEHYRSWTQDEALLNRVVEELAEIPNLRYVHFLGGETLYDPAFYKICDKMIETGLAEKVIVGTTTNGTVFNSRIESYIERFQQFHLGISIETVTPLNDYIRWPSTIDDVLRKIQSFNNLRANKKLYISLRITPNVFTISHLDSIARFMIENEIAAESCNILHRPAMLRMELMPDNIRASVISKLRSIIAEHDLTRIEPINARKQTGIQQAISNVIFEYLNFLESYEVPKDAFKHRCDLVNFIKSFEKIRGNSILDYAPEYTKFLRDHGY